MPCLVINQNGISGGNLLMPPLKGENRQTPKCKC